jgi:wobble nucleotide-excising tRNase
VPKKYKLLPADCAKRVKFSLFFLKHRTKMKQKIIMTNEAYFYVTPTLNNQNTRYWLTEPPSFGIKRILHDEHILVY